MPSTATFKPSSGWISRSTKARASPSSAPTGPESRPFSAPSPGWHPPGADRLAYRQTAIGGLPAAAIVGLGIAMVPEGRRLFPSLSVEENLLVGAHGNRPGIWDPVAGVRPLPPAQGAPERARHLPQRRRAADGGDREGVDGEPRASAVRRAVARARADRNPGSLRNAPGDPVRRGSRWWSSSRTSARPSPSPTAFYCFQGRAGVADGPAVRARAGMDRPSVFRCRLMMEWASTVINGVLTGGHYAMLAAGLAIIFGVMRLVNITHGDLIALAAFVAMVVVETTGLNPFASLVAVLPVMVALGYLLQRGILNYTLGDDLLPPLLVTFGLSIILQNLLLEVFSADSQRLDAGRIETASIGVVEGLEVGVFPLVTFVVAIAMIAAVQAIFSRTKLGRAFRATSDRRRDRPTHGDRPPAPLRAGHGALAGSGRHRGDLHRHPHQLRSVDRAFAAAVRVRGGHSSAGSARSGEPWPGGSSSGSPRTSGPRSTRGGRSSPGTSPSCSSCSSGRTGCFPGPAMSSRHPDGADGTDPGAVSVTRATRASRFGAVLAAVLIVLLITGPWWLGRADMRLLVEIFYFLALAQMWNLLAGYGGLVSVGQQAFIGLGGYLLFILAIHFGVGALWTVPLAGVIGAVVSLPIAFLVFRLRGHYFAIGTWVVAEVFSLSFAQVTALGGGSGMSLPHRRAPDHRRQPRRPGVLRLLAGPRGGRRGHGRHLPAAHLAPRPRPHRDPGLRGRRRTASGSTTSGPSSWST